jgi:hypothetical protein
MLRAGTVLALAALTLFPAALTAQQAGWLFTVSGGYANGIGDTFEQGGSVSVIGSVYRPMGRNADIGLELGYHGLGTETTLLRDFDGQPGSTYREDFSWSAWQATVGARIRPSASRVRPYATAGAGAYLLRSRDVIEVRDAASQPIPFYEFRQTNAELRPGLNAGVGADRLLSLGRLGLGVHARWHGIVAPSGIADFFSVSVGLSLD